MNLIRKSILFLSFLTAAYLSFAQHKVTFIIAKLPSYTNTSDPIYLAGNFNNWNPGDEKLRLQPTSGKIGITIELPAGMNKYKFTRGGWDKVESADGGFPTEDRKADIEHDTTIYIDIAHWGDHFPKKPKESTANKNVHILDTAFYIPQLNRHRRIWIYLPASYQSTKKSYPVLYMHDGQNVFDDATSFSGEWGVDEALDTLEKKNGESIVVAIDNGGDKRMNEYSPYDMEKYGKGEGDKYVDFIVQTLMPYINSHYRTRKSGKYNFIAGSSMGGLISFYAILKYPNKFGGAGVFSPAFWISPGLKNIDPAQAKKVTGKIYFYAGGQESKTMVPDMMDVVEQMKKHSKATIKSVVLPEGKHNEATWKKQFPSFYTWLNPGDR